MTIITLPPLSPPPHTYYEASKCFVQTCAGCEVKIEKFIHSKVKTFSSSWWDRELLRFGAVWKILNFPRLHYDAREKFSVLRKCTNRVSRERESVGESNFPFIYMRHQDHVLTDWREEFEGKLHNSVPPCISSYFSSKLDAIVFPHRFNGLWELCQTSKRRKTCQQVNVISSVD